MRSAKISQRKREASTLSLNDAASLRWEKNPSRFLPPIRRWRRRRRRRSSPTLLRCLHSTAGPAFPLRGACLRPFRCGTPRVRLWDLYRRLPNHQLQAPSLHSRGRARGSISDVGDGEQDEEGVGAEILEGKPCQASQAAYDDWGTNESANGGVRADGWAVAAGFDQNRRRKGEMRFRVFSSISQFFGLPLVCACDLCDIWVDFFF